MGQANVDFFSILGTWVLFNIIISPVFFPVLRFYIILFRKNVIQSGKPDAYNYASHLTGKYLVVHYLIGTRYNTLKRRIYSNTARETLQIPKRTTEAYWNKLLVIRFLCWNASQSRIIRSTSKRRDVTSGSRLDSVRNHYNYYYYHYYKLLLYQVCFNNNNYLNNLFFARIQHIGT